MSDNQQPKKVIGFQGVPKSSVVEKPVSNESYVPPDAGTKSTGAIVDPKSAKEGDKSGDAAEATSADYYFNSYSHFGIHEEMLKVKNKQVQRREKKGESGFSNAAAVFFVFPHKVLLSLFFVVFGERDGFR